MIDPGPGPGRACRRDPRRDGGRADRRDRLHPHPPRPQPGSRPLAAATGAPIIGCAPLALEDDGPRADAAFDFDYAPDRVLADGETLVGRGLDARRRWRRRATPRTISASRCEATGALFTGDHVMGWSTTVVSPPDGDMAAYMASLDKLLGARRQRLLSRARPGGREAAPPRPRADRAPPACARSRSCAGSATGDGRHPGDGRDHVCAASIRACIRAAGRSVLAHLHRPGAARPGAQGGRGMDAGRLKRLAARRLPPLARACWSAPCSALLLRPAPSARHGARSRDDRRRDPAVGARAGPADRLRGALRRGRHARRETRLGLTARKTLIMPGMVRYERRSRQLRRQRSAPGTRRRAR